MTEIFDAEKLAEKLATGDTRESSDNGALQLDDFVAYMPQHTYIFRPSGEMWPAASINARIPPVILNPGAPPAELETIPASAWLDRNRPVEQMTWAPGAAGRHQGPAGDRGRLDRAARAAPSSTSTGRRRCVPGPAMRRDGSTMSTSSTATTHHT